MDLIGLIGSAGPWAWIVLGLVLLGLELLAPGVFLVWLGIAGVLTGLVTLIQPLPWPVQWLVFAALSLVSILVWMQFSRARRARSTAPELNRRTDRYIGHEAVLASPIKAGFGQLPLDDSVWRISGPDLPAGARVRVVGADGSVLRVEPI